MTDQHPSPLTWAAASARRLERHGLAATTFQRPEQAVAAMCGAHAQIPAAAELSVGLRLDTGTRGDVRDALWSEHRLVKTFGPRGTVHLLATDELALWTGALSALPQAPVPLPEEARLTPDQTDQVVEAIAGVLADAELTVDELTEALVDHAGPWAGDLVMPAFQTMWPRWRQAVGTAAARGALCFGPNRGRNTTYTSPQRWCPGFRPADGTAGLAWLVHHYLYAYGPATPAHFARWLATSPAWASRLFASLSDELTEVEVDGVVAVVPRDDVQAPAEPARGVRLLPYFDAFVVGCHPRDRLFPGPAASRALSPSGQAGNYPVLLVDGVVAGVWHQRRSGRRIDVTVEPLDRLAASARSQLDQQVERVAEVLEAVPALTIGPVSVGPHA